MLIIFNHSNYNVSEFGLAMESIFCGSKGTGVDIRDSIGTHTLFTICNIYRGVNLKLPVATNLQRLSIGIS